ncbi:MAG: metallophosphoesterase [Verrucomicrobiota bacterium]|nr:metallophosphoesterase [Verrucomicrobiota bacterium]
MRIWTIADLHLSFGVENKSMDYFGPAWVDHAKKMADHWRTLIAPEDLVLIPGDISWAMKVEEAIPDLQWIHDLPGTKVLLKGNHDYWWGSLSKVAKVLPPSIHLIQNNAFHWKEATVGGARLWDTPEYSFGPFIEYQENPRGKKKDTDVAIQEDLSEKIFERELQRLDLSLSQLKPEAKIRIAMTHYPPIGADLKPSRASAILEKYKIDICVFGHLHNIKSGFSLFGEKNGIRYVFAAADYLRFQPICIV